MRFSATENNIQILHDRKIFTTWKGIFNRPFPNNEIILESNIRIEEFSGIYKGNSIPTIGSFSYSHSAIPAGVKIGRYCAISWGLIITGPRHPVIPPFLIELMGRKSKALLLFKNRWRSEEHTSELQSL